MLGVSVGGDVGIGWRGSGAREAWGKKAMGQVGKVGKEAMRDKEEVRQWGRGSGGAGRQWGKEAM